MSRTMGMGFANTLSLARMSGNVRAWLRAGPARSSIVQRLYGWAEYTLGCIALAQKRYFRAADHFCKASRRIEGDTSSRRRARAHLKAFFEQRGKPQSQGLMLQDFLRTREAAALRARFASQAFPRNVTFREALLPLKAYDPLSGEKGVLILTYNFLFQAFHSLYRTTELKDFYWMVLEPSYHRIEDPGYFLFDGWRVLLQAGNPLVRSGMRWLKPGFETVELSSSDWTDSDTFRPLSGEPKVYDLIYVANWSRNKRHELLFQTLKRISRALRVALIGFTWERRRSDIVAEMNRYGVADRCEIFERVSATEVNRLLNLSRVSLLLSRHEGGNKALYEAMFADVPSIVYRHCQGLDAAGVNEQTGVLVDDDQLADAILDVLDSPNRFSPREWALEHTGSPRSTRILNDRLREVATARGEPWRTGIAHKVNRSPFAYKFAEDAERLRPAFYHLSQFVRR